MNRKTNVMLSIITLSLVYAISCIFKMSSNIVMPIFQDSFNMTSSLTGFITGSYYFLYAPMQLLAGPLCHKWNAHKVVGTFIIISALGSIVTAFATSSITVLIGRTLIGLGVGPIYISTIYYIYTITNSKTYPIAIGLSMTVGNLGAAISSGPLKHAIDTFGIKNTFLCIALLLVLNSIVLFVLNALSNENVQVCLKKESLFQNLKTGLQYLVKSPMLIMGTIMWLMFNSLQLTYQGLWSAKWFVAAYPKLSNVAPWSATVAAVGLSVGSLVAEPLRIKKHPRWKSTSISEFGLSLMGFLIVISHQLDKFAITSNSLIIAIVLTVDFFIGYSMGAICLMLTAITRDRTDSSINANIMGIMNGSGSIACIFFQWLTGKLYDGFSQSYTPNTSYSFVFLIMSLIIFVVAIITSYTQKIGK